MESVYLDKNALSDLWRSTAVSSDALERVRRRLVSVAFRRRPRVVIGARMVSELSRTRGTPSFQREVDFLRHLPRPGYLKDVRTRVREEFIAATTGQIASPFLAEDHARLMLDQVLSEPRMWKAEEQRINADAVLFQTGAEEARKLLRQHLPDNGQRAKDHRFTPNDVAARARRLCVEILRANASVLRLDLPTNDKDLPEPSTMPTLWANATYQAARGLIITRQDRKARASDAIDREHYSGAIHAEVFVSSDRAFGEIVACCPQPRPQLQTFAAWAEALIR